MSGHVSERTSRRPFRIAVFTVIRLHHHHNIFFGSALDYEGYTYIIIKVKGDLLCHRSFFSSSEQRCLVFSGLC